MLPSTRQNSVGIATVADFGAESSRPASLLCTLRTHQSPGEWQHSLPACSLALTGRDLHPLDFLEWFPFMSFQFPHFHAFPARSVGASRAPPCFRFHTPLIEPDVRICRIRLSEKTHAIAVAIACDAVCNFWKQLGTCQAHRQSPFPSSLLASAFN